MSNKLKVYISIFVILIVSFPIFLHLGTSPLQVFDEARLANNAVEMVERGDLITTYFADKPDMWNLKPPLMIWCQALCIKFFGISELSIRLPSAIAAVLIIIGIIVYSEKVFNTISLGWIASIILVTSSFSSSHASRTGDYDILLTLFLFCFTGFIFLYLETNKLKYWYVAILFLALSSLTKGIVPLILCPGFFIYTIVQKKIASLLKSKHTYYGILLYLSLVLSYYLLREHFNDGYLNAVWNEELGGRFLTVIEEHNHKWYFYIKNLMEFRFSKWLFLSLASIALIKKDKLDKFITLLTIISASYIMTISLSKTKLEWYDLVVFPYLAFTAAYTIFKLISLQNIKKWSIIILLISFIPFYILQVKKSISGHYTYHNGNDELVIAIKKFTSDKSNVKDIVICSSEYRPDLLFYTKMYKQNGFNIKMKYPYELISGDVLLVKKTSEFKDLGIDKNYKLHDKKAFKIYEIL